VIDGNGKPIPEYFNWYVLRQITEALLALQDGVCASPKTGQPSTTGESGLTYDDVFPHSQERQLSTGVNRGGKSFSTWRPLIHSDIKDAKIFLCSEDSNYEYPKRPRVVLADFDVSMRGEEASLAWFRSSGTIGWKPPVSRDSALT